VSTPASLRALRASACPSCVGMTNERGVAAEIETGLPRELAPLACRSARKKGSDPLFAGMARWAERLIMGIGTVTGQTSLQGTCGGNGCPRDIASGPIRPIRAPTTYRDSPPSFCVRHVPDPDIGTSNDRLPLAAPSCRSANSGPTPKFDAEAVGGHSGSPALRKPLIKCCRSAGLL
jgi:hypothetical protein